jgi:glycosyltransferase involved in cell wall biosynthesis
LVNAIALGVVGFMAKLKNLKDTGLAYLAWGRVLGRCAFGAQSVAGKRPKLMLIAWQFPPEVTGGVYRPLSLARYAEQNGWDVTVVSAPAPTSVVAGAHSLAQTIPSQVRVHRLPMPTTRLRPSYRWFPRLDGGFLCALDLVTEVQTALADENPAVVLATGPPFHSFVAAYYLSKFFRARLALDYRDEWTECPFSFVEQGNCDRRWETRCLAAADLVIFTTESMRDHQLTQFPTLDRSRTAVVANGWEPADFPPQRVVAVPRSEEMTLAFIGNMVEHSLPERFLSLVEKLLERDPSLRTGLKLQFVGKRIPEATQQFERFAYPELLDVRPHVPKAEANRLMSEASALVLFCDERFRRYLPGKLFDYLAAGRPIILLGAEGEAARLIAQLEAGFLVRDGDVSALQTALQLIRKAPPAAPERPAVARWLEAHTRRAMAADAFALLNSLLETHSHAS